MRKLLKSRYFNYKWLMFVTFIALLTACGGSTTENNSGSDTSLQTTGAAITIDNAGVIPVFANHVTSTIIYVHNNTSSTISGINYNLDNEDSNNAGSIDDSQCIAIAAGQSCALKIITPKLSTQQAQGSMSIRASYNFANKPNSFSQLINYALLDPKSEQIGDGVKFKSGASISAYGNKSGYAMLYLYASGSNQNYIISDITINKPSLRLDKNYNQSTLAANTVQAIEVSSPITPLSIDATVTIKSSLITSANVTTNNVNLTNSDQKNSDSQKSLSNIQFSNSTHLAVQPVSAGAILTTGIVPLINTVNGTNASMLIQNAGNHNAVIGSISAETGISSLSGCSNTTLASGDVCTINFSVTETGGSANINIPYTGGSSNSITGNVTWFNGAGAALVSIAAMNNPLSFSATLGATTQVTITNIGGYTLSNITISTPRVLGGQATAVIVTTQGSDTCTGQELDVGASCSYVVSVNDDATDLNQQINLGFNANYAGSNGTTSYSRVMPLTYNSTAYGAIITLSSLSNMSISGDNIESEIQNLTISNNGAADATLTSIGLVDNPAYLLANNGDCGASLAAGNSCTLALKLGPTYNSSSTESTGTANYLVNYAAVGQTPAGVESTSVAWSVSSNIIQPPIISMVASVTGCASGNGITTTCMDNPTATGGTAGNIQVVLTFSNSSTVTAANTISLPESSSSLFTVPGYTLASNSCANGASANNGSCTIVYNLPSSVSASAFQSNLSQDNFAYDYTYGASGELSGSGTNNLATMINIVMPTLAIESINTIAQTESYTAIINWSNLYQATTPSTATSATESNGSVVTGLSSATPATCSSVASNIASCTALITTTNSTPVATGYLLKATAAGGLSATPESFSINFKQCHFCDQWHMEGKSRWLFRSRC
ncbi:MAG: hypothetical protein EKK54_05505 [Neisseriaceae bacterium]|nr:MAG: hypothetical protein EKK54_05505 [Neisseriaceae bacterium]